MLDNEFEDNEFEQQMPGNVRYSQGTYNGSQSTYDGDPGKTLPARSMSMDSLSGDKNPQEYVPSRISRLGPKVNANAAMQFVKAGPASLYKTANEQIKKADTVKALRKQMTVEEEDWQQQPSSSSSSKGPYDEGDSDWQTNLDKWKSSRRKRNEDALVRVIEIKKNEEDEQFQKTRRKSKTFNEMQEDKSKRGRRYNLVVHDDDNSDLSELGLGIPPDDKSTTSINDIHDDNDNKDLDNDNKDAKSDAGFCTGSDTGSDGVFAEDNISDTSSALGDKKEAHDSLLDPGVSKDDELHMNGHNLSMLTTSLTSSSLTSSSLTNSTLMSKDKDSTDEYTYDKAIEGYKQFAVNSVKRRTPSITSLNSNASFASTSTKEDEKEKSQMRASSPSKSKGLEDKLSFFTKEMEKDYKTSPETKVVIRGEKPKIDVGKRRSMFELGDVTSLQQHSHNSTSSSTIQEQKHLTRRASDIAVPGSLKNRVKSFENLDSEINRSSSITPQRDTKFHEKLASFHHQESDTEPKQTIRKNTPDRDTKFHEKLASFHQQESEIEPKQTIRKNTPDRDTKFHEKLASFHQQESVTEPKQTIRKNTPERDLNFHKKLASFTSINHVEEEKILERKLPNRRDSTSLRNRIASFEQLDQTEETHNSSQLQDESLKSHDRSVSLEHLAEEPKSRMTMRPAVSTENVMRRIQSTPYMVVDIDNTVAIEEEVQRSNETVVNAQVFELASKLEETPLIGSPTDKSDTLVTESSAVSSSVSTSPPDLVTDSADLYKQPSQTNINFTETQLHTQNHITQSNTSSFIQDTSPVAQNNNIEIKFVKFKEEANVIAANDVISANVTNNAYDHHDHDDSFEFSTPYTDEDINEVISDYEQVEGGTNGDGELIENIYENITDEYMYENIYEKVGGDNSVEMNSPQETFIINEPHYHTLTTEIEHQYQTLDEVRSEVQKIEESSKQQINEKENILPIVNQQHLVNEFILPPVNHHTIAVSATPEVLDVTWTDGPSQVAPPSEPPPPPPPDDDSDDDNEQHLLAQNEDPNFTREKSTRRLKKELWRRRSDFLGTSSHYNEEETTVKPPPNLSDILRQECESERRLLESHSPRLTQQETILKEDEIARREREIIENLERSEKLQQQNRTKYLWEDRMRDDQGTTSEMNEVDEHLQYQEANTELSTTLGNAMEPDVVKISPESSTNIPEISNTDLVIPENQLESFDIDISIELSNNIPEISNTDIVTSENQLETLESELTSPSDKSTQLECTIEEESSTSISKESVGLPLESHINSSHCEASSTPGEPIRTEAENVEVSEPIQPDRLRNDSIDSQDESIVAYKKLAELEEEMMRHDKGMLKKLQAASNSHQLGHIPPPTPYASQEEPPVVPPLPLEATLDAHQSNNYSFDPPQPLPIQEFYTAPSYEPPPPMIVNEIKVQQPATSPSQYNTLASPHPYTRSHSQSSIHPTLSSVRSTPGNSPRDAVPEPLPRKKNLPPPPPEKPHQLQQQYLDLNSNERQEALRLSRFSGSESSIHTEMSDASVASVSSGQHMTKQTLLALSAIPKPKLTENESWIKRKAENKRDYSKHWLIQEAEQRRLEDQDRIPRQKQGSQLTSSQQLTSSHHHSSSQHLASPQNSSPQNTSPQHSSPPQTSPVQHQSSNSFITQNNNQIYSNYSQSSSYASSSSSSNVNNSSHTNNVNNNNKNWRNAATTYQPSAPATATTPPSANDKALPDSIIHNLTQRVNNKNIKNTYSNTNVRNGSFGTSSYRGDENYHDYMNAEALSAASALAPIYQSAQPAPAPITTSQQTSQQQQEEQDQRLLSVSGKKKCSHCGEELGRGAAMIIESLRLFYHIPCFKCCVCGIQLGNGSAGADVRVRNHKLHCHNCYSNDEGMKFSKV